MAVDVHAFGAKGNTRDGAFQSQAANSTNVRANVSQWNSSSVETRDGRLCKSAHPAVQPPDMIFTEFGTCLPAQGQLFNGRFLLRNYRRSGFGDRQEKSHVWPVRLTAAAQHLGISCWRLFTFFSLFDTAEFRCHRIRLDGLHEIGMAQRHFSLRVGRREERARQA